MFAAPVSLLKVIEEPTAKSRRDSDFSEKDAFTSLMEPTVHNKNQESEHLSAANKKFQS